MQKILGYMRKAIQEFDLIRDGDKIAVGVSGGKDSLVLLKGLVLLKRFIGIDYDVVAITLDPRFGGIDGDYSEVQKLCDELGVPYILKRTDIGVIVFDIRKEEHPCSLCARMRRGGLHDAAIEAGCNKIALGHHYNDAVETFMMNRGRGAERMRKRLPFLPGGIYLSSVPREKLGYGMQGNKSTLRVYRI